MLRSLVGQRLLSEGLCPWNVAGNRSIFSFFKKWRGETKSDAEQSEGTKGTHAELIWSEATKTLLNNQIAELPKTAMGLRRSQLKRLKKAAFLDTVELFKSRSGNARRGFNEFILAALKEMKNYEVADDLEAYKALLTVLPRGGRLKAKSFLHADMGAYKQQQDTVVMLLIQLNANQVMPDDDMGNTLVEVFGFRSFAMSHYRRMMYWVPKMRHANPWPVVERLPDDLDGEDALRLAELVAARICPDPSTLFTPVLLASKDENDQGVSPNTPNCLVSAQSPTQQALLSSYVTSLKTTDSSLVLYLDGPQFVWYRNLQLGYYVLWGHLPKQRLENQVKQRQTIANRLGAVSDTASWDFPLPGLEREGFVPLQPVVSGEASTSPPRMENLLPVKRDEEEEGESSLLSLRPNRKSLMRTGAVATAERRRALWAAGFGPEYRQLTHLPENLSRHEQPEGVVLAVGVVAPIATALENQLRAYGGETSAEMPDPSFQLPIPAPPALIQQWLNELRLLNPALDAATVIIRNRGTEEGKQ